MRFPFCLLLASLLLLCGGCDRSTREGDLLFISFRFGPNNSAYVCATSKQYVPEGFAMSFNANPHLRISGAWSDLTWVENKPDGTKETKHLGMPVSNIYELVWKGD